MKAEATALAKQVWTIISAYMLKLKSINKLKGIKVDRAVKSINAHVAGGIVVSNKPNSLFGSELGLSDWIWRGKPRNGEGPVTAQGAGSVGEPINVRRELLCDQESDVHSVRVCDSDDRSPRLATGNDTPIRSEMFSSENEIDSRAGAFIKGFRSQMRLQKQESYNTYQAMLERSV